MCSATMMSEDIAAEIDAVARDRFALDYLYPYQRLAITNIVEAFRAGKLERSDADTRGNQIVILPTGAGKSLCFLLPAAIIGGTTLVVYPLKSLMADQERRIATAGYSVAQLKGGQTKRERSAVFDDLKKKKIDFILSNPETLAGDRIVGLLANSITHLVIDEAHCIAEWGDSFRPAYLGLRQIVSTINAPLCTAFTATASEYVVGRIREVVFEQSGAHVIRGNPDRENITYTVQPALSLSHSVRAMFKQTSRERPMSPIFHPGDSIELPAIVFCRTRSATQRLARAIERSIGSGRVRWYHAGLDTSTKTQIEKWFFASHDTVLCATCAYGLGVDKPDIRTVVHTYIPQTAEAYLQESGRAGRDRDPSRAIVLIDPKAQRDFLAHLVDGTVLPTEEAFFSQRCRRDALLEHFGATIDSCAGCDICLEGSRDHHHPPRGSRATETLLASIGSSRCPRGVAEWMRIWTGSLSWLDECTRSSGTIGYGSFYDWSEIELEEAIDGLVRLGFLTTDPYLRPTHEERGPPSLILPFRADTGKKGPRRPYPRLQIPPRLFRRRRPQTSPGTSGETR